MALKHSDYLSEVIVAFQTALSSVDCFSEKNGENVGKNLFIK